MAVNVHRSGTRETPSNDRWAGSRACEVRALADLREAPDGRQHWQHQGARSGEGIGHWFTQRASVREETRLDVIDLADYAFPGRYQDCPTLDMIRFTGAIDRADAFVIVTPEYNRSSPASLKQAIV